MICKHETQPQWLYGNFTNFLKPLTSLAVTQMNSNNSDKWRSTEVDEVHIDHRDGLYSAI